MADELRNFRSYYYEKFGFRNVEEKKSVEILLKEQPIHLDKLRQFCVRFPVPSVYRFMVWKILLGVIPVCQDSQEFVDSQRVCQYNDLLHALKLLRKINSETPQEQIFLKMFLLEEGELQFDEENMLEDAGNRAFIAMAKVVCQMLEEDIERYWVTTQFYRYFDNFKDRLHMLPAKTKIYLEKEDSSGKLLAHFQMHNVLASLPLTDWFRSCFAGVLPQSSFERVWDKVIGGSYMILAFVAVAIFLTLHRPLLSMNSTEKMVEYLTKIPADTGDILVNEAISLWQKHGYHLSSVKSDSPNFLDRVPP